MADMKSYYITEINKRRKWEEGVVNHGVLRQLTSLQGFSLEEVLRKNAKSKSWFMLGTFKGSSDQAVVLLEKTAFSNESVEYLCQNTILELKSENDNFYTYSAKVPVQENAFIVTVICPAKKDCIMQYTEHERFVVTETADLYKKITIPYLKEKEKEGESRIQGLTQLLGQGKIRLGQPQVSKVLPHGLASMGKRGNVLKRNGDRGYVLEISIDHRLNSDKYDSIILSRIFFIVMVC
ncbi:hypothetical protein CHS0354_038463 [Potamilus streckersoni]|uniref:m7GpppX diphosphatase n=1 Tax=Potamilus streckersoni TaxID=2493646 RepID=A0AAE0S6R2_9BIVA|nr:hypothetical protein CHS0354_038463 [Potamilus streckersoni]